VCLWRGSQRAIWGVQTPLLSSHAVTPPHTLRHTRRQVGIELKFKDAGYRHMAAVSHIPELNKV
jgi:hypothetical protein